MGVRVWGSGFRVQGSGFRVQGSGLRAQGSGFRVRVQGSGLRVQGLGFRVQGSGYTALGSRIGHDSAVHSSMYALHGPLVYTFSSVGRMGLGSRIRHCVQCLWCRVYASQFGVYDMGLGYMIWVWGI